MSDFIGKITAKIENRLRRKRDFCIVEEASDEIERYLLSKESEYRLNTENRKEKIIVSLTSYPARFEKLHLVIRSMLVQTMPPDEIILYLDDDVVDGKELNGLPESLKEMKMYGFRIEKRSGRIKPHKKYYYAIKEHPNDVIITVDDDNMYPPQLIEYLFMTHCKFPKCVVATRAHRIKYNYSGKIHSYNEWNWADSTKNKPLLSLMATGVGGVLYPQHCMHDDLLNMDLLLELSPNADDLWLKVMQVLVDTKVVMCDSKISHLRADIQGTQEQSLNSSNVHKCVNDEYMQRLIKHYNLQAKDFGIKNKI